jgi:hypothetical protein
MRFSPRFAALACAVLGLSCLAGCDRLSFMPQPKKKVVSGYEAVTHGMSERQVVQLLGAPTRRSGINLEGAGVLGKSLTYVKGGHLMTVVLAGDEVVSKERH